MVGRNEYIDLVSTLLIESTNDCWRDSEFCSLRVHRCYIGYTPRCIDSCCGVFSPKSTCLIIVPLDLAFSLKNDFHLSVKLVDPQKTLLTVACGLCLVGASIIVVKFNLGCAFAYV